MNIQENEQPEELIQQDIPQLPQLNYSKLFRKSALHYTITNTILLLHSLLKFAGCLTFLILFHNWSYCLISTEPQQGQQAWIYALAIHSLIAIMYYLFLVVWLQYHRNAIRVASALGESFPDERNNEMRAAEETRKISLMAIQIRYEVQKKSICGKFMGRFCFISYQICFFWGMSLFFKLYPQTTGCENLMFNFLVVVLFLGIYQYIDFYILFMFALICSPLLIIYGILKLISLCQSKRQQVELERILQSKKYQPNMLQGDPQCSICYSAYELEEDIVQLLCSPIHHFHEGCIKVLFTYIYIFKSWLNVSNSCPLCRSVVA